MTINDSVFNSIKATNLLTDMPIISDDWQAIAENLNLMYKHATGLDFDGNEQSALAHNHSQNKGAKIPFYQSFFIGHTACSFCNGYKTSIPFTRLHSSADTSDYLKLGSSPHPQTSSSIEGNRHRIWFDGDVEAYFSDGHYVTLSDSQNNSRYLFKSATYYSELDATLLCLWDFLYVDPPSSTTVYSYHQNGEENFYAYLPDWADSLNVLLPVAATFSVSTTDGEQHLIVSPESGGLWAMRARLICGSENSDWIYFHPSSISGLAIKSFRLDCRNLTKNTIHTFKIELEHNPDLLTISPVIHDQFDLTLWFKNNLHEPRAKVVEIFSRY